MKALYQLVLRTPHKLWHTMGQVQIGIFFHSLTADPARGMQT